MMKIYPEPVRDKIWFEFSKDCEKESRLSILDAEGSILILKRIDRAVKGDTFMLDLSKLSPGSYKLILEIDNKKHSHNIVVD